MYDNSVYVPSVGTETPPARESLSVLLPAREKPPELLRTIPSLFPAVDKRKLSVAPPARERPPSISLPSEVALPGLSKPPAATVTVDADVPTPPSVAPPATVSAEVPELRPLRSNVPALIAVGPVKEFVPASVSVEEPVFTK